MYNDKCIEKYLLREAFKNIENYFDEILWRPKEGFFRWTTFSENESWHKIIQEHVETIDLLDDEFKKNKDKYTFNTPLTKESYWCRKLFEEYFSSKSNVDSSTLGYLTGPSEIDPSARELMLS